MKQINYNLLILYFLITFGTIILNTVHAYLQVSLDSPSVCSPNTKKRLKLSTDTKSAMWLTQRRLSDHVLEWHHDFLCKFEVKLDRNWSNRGGIFAVIQHIVFRKNEVTGECIDYVQFKLKDHTVSKKFCGRFNAALAMDELFIEGSDFDHDDEEYATRNSFIDRFGELDVYIFIAKEALQQHEETDISIVFTAYKPCDRASSLEKPCDENFYNKVCINNNFFQDGVYNCPYINCVDEGGCSDPTSDDNLKKDSIGNKVLIGSVTSLLITFGLFICCIYACRKYGKLCWAEEFANSSSATTQSRVIPMTNTNPERPVSVVVEEENQRAMPSAPTLTSQEDKDLPPSYDSLFPSR